MLHRQIAENELWFAEPFTKGQAWIDLVLFANHKDGSFWVRGVEVKIKRGQLGWSEVTMAKRWTWSRDKVRRFLKWLETRQQIEQQKVAKITTIITICNYDRFQNDTTDDTTDRQQKDNRRYTNNNVKNDKNDKKTVSKDTEGKPSKYEDGSKIILLPEERMSNLDDRDRSFPRKRTWGDEKIDWTLDYLEFKLDRKLSGQEKWNRIYARHLANKIGMGKVKVLVDWITQPDCWWFDKIGQVSTIYKNVDKLHVQMEAPKEKAKGKTIEELTISAKNL